MSRDRIVVTGGAGFIGSHLTEALLGRGYRVVVYDNLSVGRRENVPADADFIPGDVRDARAMAEVLDGAAAVFHLAARVSVRDSLRSFAEDADVNLLGTVRVLEACRQAPPRTLILASSMAVYADSPEPSPVSEHYATEPISPYGLAKLAAERYCLLLCPSLGVRPVALRFFNTYGTRQTDTPYVGVISIFVRRLLSGDRPTIFGTGRQCRDFVHVSDIVRACILALETPGAVGAINVGTGRATSVNDLAAMLCGRIAPEVRPDHAPAQPGELANCIADITRARQVLGYRPEARIEERIDEVIDYLRHQAAGLAAPRSEGQA